MTARFTTQWDAIDPFDSAFPHLWVKIEHLGRYLYSARLFAQIGTIRVADIGCGNGYGSRELSATSADVFAIDEEAGAFDSTPVAHPGGSIDFHSLRAGSGELLAQFGPGYFDGLVCFEVLEHSVDPGSVLRELHQVERDGGTLIVSVPNGAFEGRNALWMSNNALHRRVFSVSGLLGLLETSGFAALEVLGQPIVAEIARNEATSIRRKLVDGRVGDDPALHSPTTIRRLAMSIAVPEQRDIERSHSIIVVARRVNGSAS